ncbi:hypothetical protein Tco_1157816 [Tanacetum coccineum]
MKRYCLVVTDDFSRFSWVFFLATKDETSEILCNLIIGLEKQLNKGRYLAPTLTKKLFANMKRGYVGEIVPLLPAMLAGAAVDQGEGSEQPSKPHDTPVDPILSTSQPPIPSPLQSPPNSPPHTQH